MKLTFSPASPFARRSLPCPPCGLRCCARRVASKGPALTASASTCGVLHANALENRRDGRGFVAQGSESLPGGLD